MRGPNVLLEATTFNWMDNSENILRKGQVWNNMTVLNNYSSILCKIIPVDEMDEMFP